jgi:cation diffusion facilitator family transporter
MIPMTALTEKCCHSPILDQGNPLAERNTRYAVLLTLVMMIAEIAGGWYYNSMALLADGWHMSSHALALGLAVVAYKAARHYAHDGRFAFGTWKIEVLAGFTSALALIWVAITMLLHSVERLIAPLPIHYNEAMLIAALGLAVNLVCAWLLRDDHSHHHHGHDHGHEHRHDHHHDLNLRAAYIHVLTDAATSVLAIVALICGKIWGANWLDPVMGIAGGVVVGIWAWGLLKDSGRVLLDAEMDAPVVQEIREAIAASPVAAEIIDLHVWRVGKSNYACMLSLKTSAAMDADYFKRQLMIHEELVHISIEMIPERA